MSHKYRIVALMSEIGKSATQCPTHSTCGYVHTGTPNCDYAFEMTSSNIRYGPGVTRELGMDVVNFNSKKVEFSLRKRMKSLTSLKGAIDDR